MSTALQPPPPTQPPSPRPTPPALLTYLIAAMLIASTLVLYSAPPSHASPGNHRPATWNMQGSSSSSDSKWTNTVQRLSVGGENYLPHPVLALQEAGPLNSVPGTRVDGGTITVNGRQATYSYEVREWRIGSARRGQTVYVTHMTTDPTGNRNNVAFVTHERPTNFRAVAARQANGTHWGMRPALGVQLPDGSWFYSFHASSNGDNNSNDAQNMMVELNSYGGSWAVLGDFNRRPENLVLPAGTQAYTSGQGTQQGGGELDYMVSNDRQTMTGWTGRRLAGAGSDHYVIEFGLRANAENQVINEETGKCIDADLSGYVSYVVPCNGSFAQNIQYTDLHLKTKTVEDWCVRHPDDFFEVARWDFCSAGDPKQIWDYHGFPMQLHSSYNLARCLREWQSRLVATLCEDIPSEGWVTTSTAPYFWGSVPRIDPSPGTENNLTGGGSTPPPSGFCPMPANPQLDPCQHISKRSIADVPVLDQTTAESPLQVHGQSGYAPTNLAVGVDVQHTHRGNLVLSLVTPNNSVYPLENIADSDSNDHVFKTYTVNASTHIANGTWKLRVQDIASGNVGTINAWNLTFPNGTANTSTTPPILDHHENFSHALTSSNSGSAPTNLGVNVYLTHPRRGDLVIKLYGPSGRSYTLEDFADSDTTANVYKNYTVDASSETGSGLWRLSVTDITTGNTGTIDAWGLSFPRPSPF